MKYTFKVIIFITLFALVTIAGSVIKEHMKAAKPENEQPKVSSLSEADKHDLMMRKVIGNMAKTLPKMVDRETELFEMNYLSGQMHSSYRLLNAEKADFNTDLFVQRSHALSKEKICIQPGSAVLRSRPEYSVHNVYYDRNNKHLATIVIDQNDCKQP